MEPQSTIPFLQYERPNGVCSAVEAPTPEGWDARVSEFLAKGVAFSCEVLATGHVALYAGFEDVGEDFAIEVSPNGPEIDAALVRLLERCQEATR